MGRRIRRGERAEKKEKFGCGMGAVLVAVAAAAIGAAVALAPSSTQTPSNQQPQRQERRIQVTKQSLSQLIAPYGEVVYSNETGSSNVAILIGQEHYNRVIKTTNLDLRQNPTLPEVQTQIYFILDALVKKHGLELVIGEGLPPGEFAPEQYRRIASSLGIQIPSKKVSAYEEILAHFMENQKDAAYTLYAFLNPDATRIIGINDQQEQDAMRLLEQKDLRLHELIATRGFTSDVERLTATLEEIRKIAAEYERMQEIRNQKTLDTAISASEALADRRITRSRTHSVIIGSAHMPHLVKPYETLNWTVYVIKPNSAEPFPVK